MSRKRTNRKHPCAASSSDYERGISESLNWIDNTLFDLVTRRRATETSEADYWKGFVNGLDVSIGELKRIKKELQPSEPVEPDLYEIRYAVVAIQFVKEVCTRIYRSGGEIISIDSLTTPPGVPAPVREVWFMSHSTEKQLFSDLIGKV